MVREESARNVIRNVEAIDILLDIMALCISAFVVAPMGYATGECDSSARKKYLERRKKDVTELVINGLRKLQ